MNTNSLGAYFQVFRNEPKVEFTIWSFRQIYPDAPLYLLSDKGDDFSELADKYNCIYEYSHMNTGVDYRGFFKHQMIEWMSRLKRCADSCNTDFLLYLEDDVWVRNKIEISEDINVAGVHGELINPKIVEYISQKYPDSKINTDRFGVCGGAIYNAIVYRKEFDNMINFINKEFDHIEHNVTNQIRYLDMTMMLLYMALGYEYSLNSNVIETARRKDWESTDHPIVHFQNKDLYQTIIKNNEEIKW